MEHEQHLVDKTNSFERGIVKFPSIYMEGAAACGKTTALNMLLDKHPEVTPFIIWVNEEVEKRQALCEWQSLFQQVQAKASQVQTAWIILENFHALEANAESALCRSICNLIFRKIVHLPESQRIFIISREKPQEEFLELFWKRKMELFSPETFWFTKEEIREMTECAGFFLNPEELYEKTGGWAGCVDTILRLSQKAAQSGPNGESDSCETTVEGWLHCYEVRSYLQTAMLAPLSSGEREILLRGSVCPWVDEALLQEVWNLEDCGTVLVDLSRKGIFSYLKGTSPKRWKPLPMFEQCYTENVVEDLEKIGNWYAQRGFVKEALQCFQRAKLPKAYRACMIRYFFQIPFLDISFEEAISWLESTPELCYLRGMYHYFQQNLEGLNREIQKLENRMREEREKLEKRLKEDRQKLESGAGESSQKLKTWSREEMQIQEILLNLYYVKPDFSLELWLERLEEYGKKRRQLEETPFHLYEISGHSCTYLCGLRDLSGLFACTKKEENRRVKIWKEYLGIEEWQACQLARLDYYLETERKDAVRNEDWELLLRKEPNRPWSFLLVKFYLFHKLQKIQPEEENQRRIEGIKQLLVREQSPVCAQNYQAVCGLYAAWLGEQEKLTAWLRTYSKKTQEKITEQNYISLFGQAKGYLMIGQYEKAKKIQRRLLPWLQWHHRYRFYTECLFGYAAASWGTNRQSQALRNVVESFVFSNRYRYVGFYTNYGSNGKEVLDYYVDWMQKNGVQSWHRKKKYHYGNVLRMPEEDYLEVILRRVKRENRVYPGAHRHTAKERLTMTETIVLQQISRGMSNEEIGTALNLKTTTVKSHVYSIYKKMGVNSRVQAILKGKEMGILD